MVCYKRAESIKELQQIRSLQKENLVNKLSLEEKKKEGFVTVSHTLEVLEQMNIKCSHIIAKDNDTVVGYALCMHPMFANDVEVLKPMFVEIEKIFTKEYSFIVMGQICIDKKYRGKGLFRQLYATMKDALQPKFDAIITEVDVDNTRSLNAHYVIGFKDLTTYISNGQTWKLIVLK